MCSFKMKRYYFFNSNLKSCARCASNFIILQKLFFCFVKDKLVVFNLCDTLCTDKAQIVITKNAIKKKKMFPTISYEGWFCHRICVNFCRGYIFKLWWSAYKIDYDIIFLYTSILTTTHKCIRGDILYTHFSNLLFMKT